MLLRVIRVIGETRTYECFAYMLQCMVEREIVSNNNTNNHHNETQSRDPTT